jgi:hypothetical protein
MSEVRNVTIKGDAATAFMGARKTRKQAGGFNSAPGPAISLGASNVASAKKLSAASNAFHTGGALSPAPVTDLVNKVVPVPLPALPGTGPAFPSAPSAPSASSPSGPSSTHSQNGGAKKKLVLAPSSRKVKGKVHLASPSPAHASHGSHGSRRSKGTRKIRVQLSCMKKRLHRAKTIKSESRQKPIAEVRRILEEAKLIKPKADGKEVPESVLRDIYVDYMHLRNRVL